uniref:Uncharacterized protein n=1 Tax=Anguilla anguilla TaxID=7936 RepID=A0A0E9VXB6_ANGAN
MFQNQNLLIFMAHCENHVMKEHFVLCLNLTFAVKGFGTDNVCAQHSNCPYHSKSF